MQEKSIRLGQFLAQNNLCSRRKAKSFLANNTLYFQQQKINDITFNLPAHLLEQPITVNGKPYYWNQKYEIILLNKPIGYICSHRQYKQYKSIKKLLPSNKAHYFFAGRLDVTSRGLMVLSNHGNYINRLTHPSFNVKKVYCVYLTTPMKTADYKSALKGVYDEGELLKIDNIQTLHKKNYYQFTLHRGRKREIRRLLRTLGYRIIDLQRIQIGEYKLNGLKEGNIQTLHLDPSEYSTA